MGGGGNHFPQDYIIFELTNLHQTLVVASAPGTAILATRNKISVANVREKKKLNKTLLTFHPGTDRAVILHADLHLTYI